MVFQKKGKGGKQTQKVSQKKPVELEEAADMFEDSDDMDSGESDDVPKTPAGKTPKGKQPASEKKVSFKVPGNNTPAKTPSKNTPAKTPKNTPGKNQINSPMKATPAKGAVVKGTPAKVGLQQFSGMKQKQEKQKSEGEDDEDSEDEDDSDFEGDDIDLAFDDDDMDDNDDDMDDDDDDDEGDDDEDDDDEQEIVPAQPTKKTPVKQVEKKSALTPKVAQTPKMATKNQSPKSTPKENEQSKKALTSALDAERRQQDRLKLYIGNLPKDVTTEEIQKLSTDIVHVNLPPRALHKKSKQVYAFLLFQSEEKAEENFQKLKNKKLRGQLLTVDFAGEKSSHKKEKEHVKPMSKKRLFIAGLPLNCRIHQISKFFPKAYQISLNNSPSYRTGCVWFWTADDCTEAQTANSTIEVDGVKVSVLHALERAHRGKKRSRKNKSNGIDQHSAKKMKFSADDDDDDDEE